MLRALVPYMSHEDFRALRRVAPSIGTSLVPTAHVERNDVPMLKALLPHISKEDFRQLVKVAPTLEVSLQSIAHLID